MADQTALNPDDFDDSADFAVAVAEQATSETTVPHWADRGDAPEFRNEVEWAIEVPSGSIYGISDDVVDQIESLSDHRDGARIVTRQVTYGPWRYALPEEIENA